MEPSEEIRKKILLFQHTEITEYHIYPRLADKVRLIENGPIMKKIVEDEPRHYDEWKRNSQQGVQSNWFKVWRYYMISRIFEFTFGIKLMEHGEKEAQKNYSGIASVVPDASRLQHV